MPLKIDSITNFSLSPAGISANYALSFHGFINITKDGFYDFYLNSDDGSNLLIGNSVIVSNDGSHLAQEIHGSIGLKAGKHAITVNYFQQNGPANLNVSYAIAGATKIVIPDSVLYRDTLMNTSVDTLIQTHSGAFLNQNYPNPASQFTRINFGVNKPGKVVITLFHSDGTEIKTLFNGFVNQHTSIDLDTFSFPVGMYLYKMVTDQGILTRSLLILK